MSMMTRSNTLPVIGDVRFNKTTKQLEIYTATTWQTMPPPIPDPQTWCEWFDYYINASGNIPDRYTKQVYIQQEMQGRFPGNYRVDLASNEWVMVFDTPADATWWHLKYD